MKILITQRKLAAFAGTEMIVLELACALQQRNHEVAVYCPRPGKVSDLLAASGIVTYSQIEQVPWRPDVIHGHHHLPTMTALAAFEDVPAIYVCHGLRPWVEHPPLHPQIRAYVAISEKMAAYLKATYPIPPKQIHIVRNFVDTARFSSVRSPLDQPPQSAILFGQSFSPKEVQVLEDCCTQNALQLDKVGYAYDNPKSNPELLLPDYDVAFAVGRSAIEAMACGCATIPIMPHLAGQLITPDNFAAWASKNFSPRYFTTADRMTETWLAGQLARYQPQVIATVTRRVRQELTLEKTADRFDQLYREAVQTPCLSDTHSALTAYLEKLAVEADEAWEAQLEAERMQARDAAALKAQTTALQEAHRQVRFLARSLLSSPQGSTGNMHDHHWIAAIEASGLFDREWYLANNPDIAAEGIDPLLHYLCYGAAEGREPSPGFDRNAPIEDNAELAQVAKGLMRSNAHRWFELAKKKSDKPQDSGAWKSRLFRHLRRRHAS